MKNPAVILIAIFLLTLAGCATNRIDESALVDWNSYYGEVTAGEIAGAGSLIIASERSDTGVVSLEYAEGRNADIFYPADMDFEHPREAVIFVAGDSDSHSKEWSGRALKDTNQYLQWGQVIADAGLIAVTYNVGNPADSLELLAAWIEENSRFLAIDTGRIGYFALNENGCAVGMETIVVESRNYSGPKPAAAVFFYGLLPLKSRQEIYLDVPVMTVQTQDFWDRGIPESMEKFNVRAEGDGAMITPVRYPEGEYYFDCKEDTPEAREILRQTLSFLSDALSE